MACKVGSFIVPVSGSQPVSGVGFRPTWVFFWGDRMSADGTTVTAAAFTPFMGVGVSSSARVAVTEADDFSSIFDTASDTTKCLKHITGSTTSFAADLTSLDSDGFTVNFTTGNGTAYVVNYLAGDDPNASLISFTTPAANGNQSYNGAGFKPDAILLLDGSNGAVDSWTLGFGVSATKRGTQTMGVNGGLSGLYQRADRVYANVNAQSLQTEADLVTLDADGFTLNWDTSNATTHTVYALCLKGGRYSVGSFTQKLSAGSLGYTGVGFQPSGLLLVSAGLPVISTTTVNLTAGNVTMIGAGSGASARGVIHYSSGSNIVGELTRSAIYTNRNDDATPTLNAKADLTTFDVDGFTLNYSTADAIAREIIYMAFGTAPVGDLSALVGEPITGSSLIEGGLR